MLVADNYNEQNDLNSALLPWIVCLAATMFFFYEFIQGNMFASIAANIMHDFHIEAEQMAYLSSIYYLSNVVFLFVSGMILDRFSIKNTILIAMLLCVVSTFVLAHSHSFYIALLCRFITGIGSAFCFLGPVRLASHWFPPQRMAFVTGAIVTVAMTGGMLAQYPLSTLVEYVGWRQAVQDVGMLGLIMMIFMLWGIKERPAVAIKEEGTPPSILTAARAAYLNPQYLRAALYTSLMNMAIAVFGAMMGTLYLEQRLGIAAGQASMINGMLFFGAIVGAPIAGWLSDKMAVRVIPMKIGVLVSLAVVLAVLYLPVSLTQMMVLFFLLGAVTSTQVISYALVAESSPPAITATAVSVVSILTQGGCLVFQNLFSYLLTHQPGMHIINGTPVYSLAAYQYAAVILPLGLLLAYLLLFGLKETYCQEESQ